MTPDKQRIAIAEACGWTFVEGLTGRPPGKGYANIPDYLGSLDAMHEAEKVLTDNNSQQYHDTLLAVQRAQFGIVTDRQFQMVHATATQRAEAFLRTIGKWEDEK